MITTSKSSIASLAHILAVKGVVDVVVSPGSRNAPISIAMNREPGLRCTVITDERCAGFVALGMSQRSKRCTAVICTSGTALLNLAPAAAEAYYQQLPLLIISADRPSEWIDQNDSQTVRQNGALANFVKASYTLPEASCTDKTQLWNANRIINEATNKCVSGKKGPVHLNIPIDNPLYDLSDKDTEDRIVTYISPKNNTLPPLNGQKRVMILAGFMQPDSVLNGIINEMANQGIAVVAEHLSNIYGENIINNVEQTFSNILKQDKPEKFCPDLLIVMGGALVSKSAKMYFRKYAAKQTWQLGKGEEIIDTFCHVTHCIDFDADMENETESVIKERTRTLLGLKGEDTSIQFDRRWWNEWIKESESAYHNDDNSSTAWNEKNIIDIIINNLTKKTDIHLSNGLSVRYGQNKKNEIGHHYYANRGVSGIDGCTSTSVGSAMRNDGNAILITGDMCFVYDSNAILTTPVPQNLTIFIINNKGGGIFRKLNGPSQTAEFERFFIAENNMAKISGICENKTFCQVSNFEELKKELTNKTSQIIEILI